MKNKLLLPLLAVVFALASAFATKPVSQMGWFHVVPDSAEEGVIDQTTRNCILGGVVQCTIAGKNAYATEIGAENQDIVDLLKYNP
jgi:hypothetical protein